MIYLARHGQTAYNVEGRFQGWGDVPLDETGRQQARQLAVAVAELERIEQEFSPLMQRPPVNPQRRGGEHHVVVRGEAFYKIKLLKIIKKRSSYLLRTG